MIDQIYAYHEPLGNSEADELCGYWLETWQAQGWRPCILGLEDAYRHLSYKDLLVQVAGFPTINSRSFELACYRRWCAFATVKETDRFVVTDTDVFPRIPFSPQNFPEGFICGDSMNGVGFILGLTSDMERIVNAILSYTPGPSDLELGLPHVSDFRIIQRTPLFDQTIPLVACYGTPNWEALPLIHFGNGYLKHHGRLSKTDEIKAILAPQTSCSSISLP